jgi:large subunit ribosomal protein L29
MEASELRSKSRDELNSELLSLRREQFNLRIKQATGQLSRPHEYSRVRKDIARLKTVMNELERKGEGK